MKSFIPKGFLWRLTILNVFVVATTIAVSGWAIYNTACFLVEGMGNLDIQRQGQFNATLFQYLWIFSIIGVLVGSMLHFYLTKKLIKPIRQLINSTKQMKKGEYPKPIKVVSQDEVGELVKQYNGLIQQLEINESHRQKLVSDLSHEFRTPLANLNGYLHALESGVIEGEKKLYTSLYKEANRLTQMVEQFEQFKEWDYIKSQSIIEKQSVDIADQIDQCAAMFRWRLIKAEIPIQVDVNTHHITIHIEGVQQVLSNLLDNGIRYYQGDVGITINGKLSAGAYRISITGQGQPIPEPEQDKIFDRFYRIDNSRSRDTGGTGLGLAIAKEIVERHGGKIGVETVGNRNTFWFTLPCE